METMPRYELPRDRQQLKDEWWTASQAARAWGVSPKTARRVFESLDEVTGIHVIDVRRKTERVVQCVRAGTLRPPVRRGNPNFASPDWQRQNSARRWDGHITAAEIAELKAAWKQDAFDDLVEWCGQFLPPPDPDNGIEDWEPPESNLDPDPPPPHFLMRWERDAYERRQARLDRGCTH